jgi:polyhydroxybutyrate depolymerase
MHRTSAVHLAFALACVIATLAPIHAAERDRAVVAGGMSRKYTLITPTNVPNPIPLIIVFHGGRQNADAARRYTRFDEFAAKENVAVVYPQGLDNNWNDGRVSEDLTQRAAANVDDVDFTLQIIAQLEGERVVDAKRVYLTGASNGGMMAMRAGCELWDRIAGIAPVIANQPVDWQCRAKRLAALFIHGTDDEYMPFAGGQIAVTKTRQNLGQVRSADDTIAAFKRVNACDGVKETVTLDKVGRDETKAVVTDYACKNAPLKHIVIEGGGHTWPGARTGVIADMLLGKTSQEVNATAEIWNFFLALQKQ